jgi:serine/threonine protein kinase
LTVVLFSEKDKCWKITDFGTASQATSKRLNTTRYSRGTSGYRAPEILDEVSPRYNSKSDIFAVGCIIYEIVTGQKLFFADFATQEYSSKARFGHNIWPKSPRRGADTDRLHLLEKLVSTMLEIEPLKRPNARATREELLLIRRGRSDNKINDIKDGIPLQVEPSSLG